MEFWRILVESFARLLLRLHFDCDCDGPDAKNVQHTRKWVIVRGRELEMVFMAAGPG